ncbi:MAG: amino acid decarboxylase [Clostridia bacterium]|nr:amino acid decarboxylase [Clostridia bacterium]
MTTPIFDFVNNYAESKTTRFHMPGHKGIGPLGLEKYDITEIKGADVLYSANGIIEESENNLSELYGTEHSFYSTEGSTLAIKAMLALVIANKKTEGRPLVFAGRNAHASFVRAAALLDIDVVWIQHNQQEHLCECSVSPRDIQLCVSNVHRIPDAVYVTSPDYLGNMVNIASLASSCRRHKIPLIVDNAHGAYLKFLPEDMHPISLGAAMCVDSAHKTLPVLTGGAYLHISKNFPKYAEKAREALSLFASTSPSYLTLASLDLCNKRLAEGYADAIASFSVKVAALKEKIESLGYELQGKYSFWFTIKEPFKVAIRIGEGFVDHLRKWGIEPEFSDSEYTVLMLTPENTDGDLDRLIDALAAYDGPKTIGRPIYCPPIEHESPISIREAILAPSKTLSIRSSVGRICAAPSISCPPAVPIVMSGERITKEDVKLFKHYGIKTVSVVK